MQPATLQTYNVPVLGSPNPATIGRASTRPLRVLVRNVGGGVIFLSHDVNDLVQGTTVSFRLDLGTEIILVLAPAQTLLAASVGIDGLVSVATSEAYPFAVEG